MKTSVNSVLLAAIEGYDLTADESVFFKEHPPAGITLFSRNVSSDNSNLLNLTNKFRDIYKGVGVRPIVAVDQEGGRVARIKHNFPNKGAAISLENGSCDAQALQNIYDYGQKIASSLIKFGINVNFAPVADVLTNEDNVAIGDRAFARTSEAVSKRALAFLKGMQTEGVLGCLKHFPGQGAAPKDTHFGESIIAEPKDIIFERDIAAFTPLLSYSRMVMMSHCVYPALHDTPASLSYEIITNLLMSKLGFDGIVVSDDMMMHSIPQTADDWCNALIKSILAGTNLLLICRSLEKYDLAVSVLSKEMNSSAVFKQAVENSSNKVSQLRKNLVC